MVAPTLTTARLTLRAPRATDIDPLTAHYADPAHFDSLGGRTPIGDQAQERAAIFVVEAANFWSALGYGPFVVWTTGEARWVGLCGFRPPPDDAPADDAHPLLVFGVDRALWRRGYASEAAQAAMTWIHRAWNGPEIHAATHPENAGAAAVLRKLGFGGPNSATRYGAQLALFTRKGVTEPTGEDAGS